MKFCVICPTSGLKEYATRSNVHLVLPHIRHKQYIEFYQERRKAGDTLILDNGAYEGQFIPYSRYERCINLYNPQVVVCPDAPMRDWRITVSATEAFLRQFYDTHPNIKFMACPQAKVGDKDGWWNGCEMLLGDERISWIALPRLLYTHFSKEDNYRAIIAQVIKKSYPTIKIHALGMASGSLSELEELAKCECVESCDSSAPVWRGWNGYSLSAQGWEENGTPVDFNAKLPTSNYLIEQNLKEVLSICS
jgi:hypothetical protein